MNERERERGGGGGGADSTCLVSLYFFRTSSTLVSFSVYRFRLAT